MTLNEFIARAVSFFDKAESGEQKEREKLNGRITELEASLAAAQGTLAQREEAVKDLQAQLEPQAVKITQLEADLAAEKTRVADTLAGLAVKPEGIPAVGGGAQPAGEKTLAEQLLAITDSSERAEFYRKHREALLAASRAERRQGQ